jgi:hypothetical protein
MALRNPAASVDERRIGRQSPHRRPAGRFPPKIQLRWDVVDMKSVAANAVELTRPMFDKLRNPVELQLAEQPAVVVGDAVRLTQVLCNLLVNAAKLTPEGCVTLALDRVDGFIETSVQDNGSGIEAQLLPGCSTCSYCQPASQPPAEQTHGEPAETPADGSGRILVDDNADAAETLAEILRLLGYEVRCAGHADAAMALLDSYVPQLALLDIGLPDIDGYQLAGLLRADPRAARG